MIGEEKLFEESRQLRVALIESGLSMEKLAQEFDCTRETIIAVICGVCEWSILHEKVRAFLVHAKAKAKRDEAVKRLGDAERAYQQAETAWNTIAANVVPVGLRVALRDETALVA